MKIFISGATGFVGGHLAESLIQEGHEIKTLVRQSSNISLAKKLEIETVYGDLTDYSSVKKAVESCEVIYHTAAATSRTATKSSVYYDVNVKGTDNVMRAALETGVRHVVHCSTSGVHGQVKKQPAKEKGSLKPDQIYRTTKLESEKVVLEYFYKYKLSTVIARLTPIYGTRCLRWLKLFQDILNQRLTMIGSGKNYFHVTYIDDITDGLKLCGKQQSLAGKCYIIGSETVPRLGQFISMIAQEGGVDLQQKNLPSAPFIVASAMYKTLFKPFGIQPALVQKVDFFTKDRIYDISQAKLELGYSPKVSLREGVKRTFTWYKDNGYL